MLKSVHSYLIIDYKNRIIDAQLTFSFWSEDDWHFAECEDLRLVEQGKTQRIAFDRLIDMISATLLAAIHTESVDKMMKELGFSRKRKTWPDCRQYERSGGDNGIPLPLKFSINGSKIEDLAFV